MLEREAVRGGWEERELQISWMQMEDVGQSVFSLLKVMRKRSSKHLAESFYLVLSIMQASTELALKKKKE